MARILGKTVSWASKTTRRIVVWGSLGLLTALGGTCTVKKCIPDKELLASQQVEPLSKGESYQGGIFNYYLDEEHLDCFKRTAGGGAAGHVDIAPYFMNFRAVSSGEPFPRTQAERMWKTGGVMHLVLEPGSGRGPFDYTYSPEEISGGHYKKQLKARAKEIVKYGGPILISLRPSRDTSYKPEQMKEAHIYLHDIITTEGGAENTTWVWHIDRDHKNFTENFPGEKYAKWVSVTLYQHSEDKTSDLLEEFEKDIKEIRKLGKPIVVEFGSSASPAIKADFITKAMAKFHELGIEAHILNHVSQREGIHWRSWALRTPEVRSAYQEAIASHDRALRRNIVTRAGELEDKSAQVKQDLNCSKIEKDYFTIARVRKIEAAKKRIEEGEEYFKKILGSVQKGDPHYNNKRRIKLSRAYLELFLLTHKEEALNKAQEVLDQAQKSPDPALVYHWDQEFIREYFELLLALANLNLHRDLRKAEEYCLKVFIDLEKLKGVKFFNPNQGRKESIPGFYHKALFIEAKILEAKKGYGQAEQRYQKVIDWSDKEAEQGIPETFPFIWESTWYRDETKGDVKYDGASSRLRSGFIKLKNSDPETALALANKILSWKRVGDKDGYLDLAFEALILSYQACLQMFPHDLNKAKYKFWEALPWHEIGSYKDLLKVLKLENYTLSDPALKMRWEIILKRLSELDLNDDLKAQINKIQSRTEILSKK